MRPVAVAVVVLFALLVAAPTNAAPCGADAGGDGGYLWVGVDCEVPGGSTPGDPGPNNPPIDTYIAYKWASVCTGDPNTAPGTVECVQALGCPDPVQRRWMLWGQRPNGSWETIRTQCFGGTPPPFTPPTVTPAIVLDALRQIGLPELTIRTQPEGRTLVNFETIFFTDPRTLTRSLVLLGQQVDVEATPTRYTWVFGDGEQLSTEDPGAAYPRQSITHRYTDARVTVTPRVLTTYSARFRVGNGAWQDIPDSIVTVGPAGSLRVAEATPLLSGQRD